MIDFLLTVAVALAVGAAVIWLVLFIDESVEQVPTTGSGRQCRCPECRDA